MERRERGGERGGERDGLGWGARNVPLWSRMDKFYGHVNPKLLVNVNQY